MYNRCMPTAKEIEDIFYIERGFYMSRSTAENIAHFLPIYFKLMQEHGIYLNDVPYTDLKKTAQHRLLTQAHDLWVKDLGSVHYGPDEKQLMVHKFIREQVLENEQQRETIEELRGIITSLTVI